VEEVATHELVEKAKARMLKQHQLVVVMAVVKEGTRKTIETTTGGTKVRTAVKGAPTTRLHEISPLSNLLG